MMAMLNNAPKQLGKYEILELVGRGGMGVVYKAVDPEIGRLVGIKMMTSAVIGDPVLLKRFYREAQSAGKLRHPNIVTIYDLGVQEAMPYIVMEFLEGESLDVALRSGRPLLLEKKLSIVIQVCNALAYAHEQNIVHRDIKPGNVMLLKDDTIKLVDFGIARIGAEYVTRTGQLMGSIQYMSPEQVHGAHVDLRTDIFSTGVLLYQMLTNALPFEGKDAGATLLKIVHDPAPPLDRFLKDYPVELDSILQRALAKQPGERYQTATELAFDLSNVEEQLQRQRISTWLESVEQSVADGQWDKSREQLLQLLKVDRRNVRANELLRDVQHQIQKQECAARIRDLQVQAEQAIARNALDEALRYLSVALNLDEGSSQLRELHDAVEEQKRRADRVAELLARAKSSFDTEDLENALASTKQALTVDAENTEAKQLHAAIENELSERAKSKQVHNHLEEARKQISGRHFTAALDLLREAERINPEAPGVNELVALASAGQQQERRRKELEQFSSEIGEALNRSDYAVACAKAAEALERFPNDRGLLKLKTLADKERENCERRTYVEKQVSLARRLLEEKKSAEALVPLQEALGRYPDEFVLQSMYSLFTEYLERDRIEQFKAKITQQAKDSIRRRAYKEAIEILEAAKRQTSSADFDDLLHFCQEEAATYLVHQKIDATAEEAHRFMSMGDYGQAIKRLEATLKEVDDQELRLILDNARSHLNLFNADLQEAIATTRRLLDVQRYSEAVKFVDSHAERFGKVPEFCQLSDQVHREQHRIRAFSVAKEHAREALASSDFNAARAALNQYRQEFDNDLDTQLLQQEIETKESESATTALTQALKDCRVLLQVGCHKAVLDILGKLSSKAEVVPPEIKKEYDFARARALAGINRQRAGVQRMELIKKQVAPIANNVTMSEAEWETAGSPSPLQSPLQETPFVSVAELESVLGEVTLIAKHYAGDQKIASAVGTVRQQLTIQIATLRRADTSHKLAQPNKSVEPQDQPASSGLDSAERTFVPNTVGAKEEKFSQSAPLEQSSALAQNTHVAPSLPVFDSTAAVAKTLVYPPENDTILPRREEGATNAAPEPTHATPVQVSHRPYKSRRSLPIKLILAAVVAAILIALIVYMVWRTTQKVAPGVAMVRSITATECAPGFESSGHMYYLGLRCRRYGGVNRQS